MSEALAAAYLASRNYNVAEGSAPYLRFGRSYLVGERPATPSVVFPGVRYLGRVAAQSANFKWQTYPLVSVVHRLESDDAAATPRELAVAWTGMGNRTLGTGNQKTSEDTLVGVPMAEYIPPQDAGSATHLAEDGRFAELAAVGRCIIADRYFRLAVHIPYGDIVQNSAPVEQQFLP